MIRDYNNLKIAIIGSRNYPDLDRVTSFIKTISNNHTIVSGGARGVDRAAQRTAERLGMKTIIYPAKWNEYGKKAGLIRNQEIVNTADVVVAFWNGFSRGTKHTINLAKKAQKPVFIFNP